MTDMPDEIELPKLPDEKTIREMALMVPCGVDRVSDDQYMDRFRDKLRETLEYVRIYHAQIADLSSAREGDDPAEAAYWRFDARRSGYNEWKSMPQSERDAFKAEYRASLRPAPIEPVVKCKRCDDTGVWYGGVDGHIEYPCDCKITSAAEGAKG